MQFGTETKSRIISDNLELPYHHNKLTDASVIDRAIFFIEYVLLMEINQINGTKVAGNRKLIKPSSCLAGNAAPKLTERP